MPISPELEERMPRGTPPFPRLASTASTTLKNKANPASQASTAGEAWDGEKANDFNGVESVKAQIKVALGLVRVHAYPDGRPAIFHGPRYFLAFGPSAETVESFGAAA